MLGAAGLAASRQEKQDQSRVDQKKAELIAGKGKAFNVGCKQVDQQHPSQQISPRPNWYLPICSLRTPHDKETVEVTFLRDVKAQVHLRQSPGKDQD